MWTRSYWVLVTYLKRPLSWLFAIIVMICMSVPFYLIDGKTQTVDHAVVSANAIRTFEQLELVLATNPEKRVELDYSQLYSLAIQKVFPRPSDETFYIGPAEQARIHAALKPVEGLRNVVAMDAGYAVDQATIQRIGKFKKLKRLSMFADLEYESLDLRPLSQLAELEEIQMGVINNVDSLVPLQDLPRLRTLRFGYGMILHKHGLDELAKLTHLQELSLPDMRSFPGLQGTVRKVAQCPNLRRINCRVSWDEAGVLADVQSQVPCIQVEPSMYRPARHVGLFFALALVVASAFPIMHVASQLSLPLANLAPHYRWPHYLVAGLMILILSLSAFGLLVFVGSNWLAASSLILFASGFFLWSATLLPSKGFSWRGIQFVNLLFGLPIATSPYLVLASRFFRPMLVEDYLMSGHVLVPIICLVIAPYGFWQGFRNLQSRLRDRLEIGLPMALSFHDLQTQNTEMPRAAYPAETGRRVFSMGMKLPVVANAALAITLLSIPVRLLGYEDLGRMALLSCFGAAFICFFLTGAKWWRELPYFAAATMRPPNRIGHVDRLMHGVSSDIMSFLPLLIASVIAFALAGPQQFDGIGIRLLHSFVAVASVTLAIYAGLLWALTIRTTIGIALVFVVCYLPCSVMMMEIVLLDQFKSPLLSVVTIVVSGSLVAAAALVAIIFVRRRFLRLEWARFK
jgi:hypothetical protein